MAKVTVKKEKEGEKKEKKDERKDPVPSNTPNAGMLSKNAGKKKNLYTTRERV